MIRRPCAGHAGRRLSRWLLILSVCMLGGVVLGVVSCAVRPAASSRRETPLPAVKSIRRAPMLRVRIVRSAQSLRIHTAGPLVLSPESRPGRARRISSAVAIHRVARGFVVRDETGRGGTWHVSALRLTSSRGALLHTRNRRYPHALVLVAEEDRPGRFDVVNHVPLERYLPGVLSEELYRSWDLDAYIAQAVASRSYALFERSRHRDRPYDLNATVASQVYGGDSSNPKAIEAVRRTRGLVLSYRGRVVPAFYSSCCGGASQTATAAFPRFGNLMAMPALRGRERGKWCTASDKYRWGPVRRETAALSRRIAAWGRAKKKAVAGLSGLRSIAVRERNRSGRPTIFVLTDDRGRRFDMPAESFRFACNYDGSGQGEVERDRRLWSSYVQPRVRGREVIFRDGRGFGHGVGLCQWGAQGLARRGEKGLTIARRMYPGARIERVY